MRIFKMKKIKTILEELIEEIENKKRLTSRGTNERAMIYNSAIEDILIILKEKGVDLSAG
ncbi:MAG: hypothetical protein UT43_C0017G0011 [Parcubacteria group bacterium GW2011_GWC1_39_29]|uniref:Uncharacterized protein n=1 Tax=Candidatus Yanofskybacteria bacterium GW2011_GWD1_39_16 TaxID=1619030 RepID=A0A837I0A3_9BACT|nr:MAG: hypothetical protein UT35_C0002G0010 [Candidatus Yanofskybacteria bacterium GW2011_GWD1_39_16]KKR14740.1 MAG: hypothetical protein UT43_C0017G0011 [Parcubacteria group bacterium GW2011_GWC1_39_29]